MLDTHARHWVQPLINRSATLLIRAKLSANQVTWAAFLIGTSTGVLICYSHPIWACVLLWISGYLDAVDGTMARQQQQTTAWGTLQDITFDRIVELSVVVGLAMKFPEAQFMLLLLTAAIVLSMTIFLTVGALTDNKGMKSFYYQAGLAERTEGFILFSFMILFPQWLWWTTGLFVLVELFTALQRFMEARKVLNIKE